MGTRSASKEIVSIATWSNYTICVNESWQQTICVEVELSEQHNTNGHVSAGMDLAEISSDVRGGHAFYTG